jgi:hypothetical protein
MEKYKSGTGSYVTGTDMRLFFEGSLFFRKHASRPFRSSDTCFPYLFVLFPTVSLSPYPTLLGYVPYESDMVKKQTIRCNPHRLWHYHGMMGSNHTKRHCCLVHLDSFSLVFFLYLTEYSNRFQTMLLDVVNFF